MTEIKPPSAIEIEKSIIASLIVESDSYLKVSDLLKPEHFFLQENKIIYLTLQEMFNNNIPIDMVSLFNILKNKNKMETIGGVAYISKICNSFSSAANIEYHSKILIEKFNGGPIGLKTIGAAMAEEEATVEEVIERDLVERGRRGIGRDVPADAVALLVCPDHHRHRVPADDALDTALDVAVAGIRRLLLRRDGVDVGRADGLRRRNSGRPQPAQQVGQKPLGAVRRQTGQRRGQQFLVRRKPRRPRGGRRCSSGRRWVLVQRFHDQKGIRSKGTLHGPPGVAGKTVAPDARPKIHWYRWRTT